MNEHQLFVSLQKPKHMSRQIPDVEHIPSGGAQGLGGCSLLCSERPVIFGRGLFCGEGCF